MLNTKEINISKDDKFKIIASETFQGVTFDVIELDSTEGAVHPSMAMKLYFMDKKNVKARFVRATLNNSTINMEAGAFYYSTGNINCSTKMGGVTGTVKSLFRGMVTGESTFRPSYTGTGEIYLEPSVKHYIMMKLDNETIVVDKSMYYCSTDGITLQSKMQSNVSGAVAGGEGLFQIELSGTGIVILESLIPESEIVPYVIKPNSPLKVDGNFAIARTGNVRFSVQRSDKQLAKSLINGEGLLQTFEGDGVVWLAPTLPFYTRVESDMIYANKGSNNV